MEILRQYQENGFGIIEYTENGRDVSVRVSYSIGEEIPDQEIQQEIQDL